MNADSTGSGYRSLIYSFILIALVFHRGTMTYLGWVQAYMHWARADCHSHSQCQYLRSYRYSLNNVIFHGIFISCRKINIFLNVNVNVSQKLWYGSSFSLRGRSDCYHCFVNLTKVLFCKSCNVVIIVSFFRDFQ